MKTFFAMTAILFASVAAPAGAQTIDAQVATAPKKPAMVCKKILQLPGADGSTAMAELPATSLLYNDRHVTGADPILLSLRALGGVRCYSDLDSSSYLIGLRNAFEAMGGTVSYSRDGKMIDVEKPGISLKLQIGKPSITLNGETRPLDVPPMIYHGIIYVPIRVISEALGGYVVWDGATRTVVVRYLPPAPPAPPTPAPPPTSPTPDEEPTAIPTAAPAATATATPAATAKPQNYTHYIAADYLFESKTYDQFANGDTGGGASFSARAAFEFPLGNVPFMIGGDYRSFAYPHEAAAAPGSSDVPTYISCPSNGYPGCVSVPGRNASVYVGAQNLRDTTVAGNVGIGIGGHTFVAGSYAAESNDYPSSYPSVPTLSGFGFGIDRLPDFDQVLSFYASGYYYPTLSGTYEYPAGLPPPTADSSGKLQESLFKYGAGLTFKLSDTPLFLDLGFVGDSIRGKNLAPGDASHAGGHVGIGLQF